MRGVLAVAALPLVLIGMIFSMLLFGLTGSSNDGPGGDYPIGQPPGPWGGYENGQIPEDELAPIPWAPGLYLRKDAVDSLIALNAAFREEFGYDISITDAYRDLAGQEDARRMWCSRGQCQKAAIPGTSNHGWALAADLGSNINIFDTAQYIWMKKNGPDFGWEHPAWAEPGQPGAEAWHWDFWGWGGSGGSDSPREFAKAQIPQVFGAPIDVEKQFACLDELWNHESNWNPHAENPSSGAYGIPQALPPEKMATVADDWHDNAETQILWGLGYIRDAYGSPCVAWDRWQSRYPHWY